MKICHMTSVHQSTDIRVFIKECCSLADAGYNVYLVAKGDSRKENNVEVIGVGNMPTGKLKRMFTFSKTVYKKALTLDCDVYHFHDPELLPYGIKLAKKGKTVIFDSHEDVPAQILDKSYIPAPLRKLISNIYKCYETHAVKYFSAVIAATPHIAEQFKGRAKKVVVINNYPKLDDIEFHTTPFDKREAIVCYAGGINELRGEKIMVEAMRNVDGTLIIAGEHELVKLESKNGDKGVVDYVGKLDRNGVNKLYGKAVVGLCLLKPAKNYINSQPIKMYEYMAAGIPFICSDFPKWKLIADKTQAGICVDPENNSAVVTAINLLLENRSISQEMGIRGRKAVEQFYSWEAESKVLLGLYHKLEG